MDQDDPSMKREMFSHLRKGCPGEVPMLAAGGRESRGSVDRLSGENINDYNICCLASVHHGASLTLPLKAF